MPLAALASFPPCYDVTNSATLLYTVDKMLAGGASEASGLMYNGTNTYQYHDICLRLSASQTTVHHMLTTARRCAILYAYKVSDSLARHSETDTHAQD